jgi:hypothetical protein
MGSSTRSEGMPKRTDDRAYFTDVEVAGRHLFAYRVPIARAGYDPQAWMPLALSALLGGSSSQQRELRSQESAELVRCC